MKQDTNQKIFELNNIIAATMQSRKCTNKEAIVLACSILNSVFSTGTREDRERYFFVIITTISTLINEINHGRKP